VNLILAHGIGSRSDLPVPLWMAMYGGGTAVVISFLVLIAFWRKARYEGTKQDRPLPGPLTTIFTSRAAGTVGRTIGVAMFALAVIVLQAGSNNAASNPGPWWFYVWFWVGLVPLSILFGPVWRAVNPLRTIAAGLRGSPDTISPYPERLGYWPAAISLFVFVWLELVYTRPSEPAVVLIFVVLYSIFNVVGGMRFDDRWFDRADGFEVYSTMLASISPFGRSGDGMPVFRNPLQALARVEPRPGFVAVVTVMLGSTAFDGITRTNWWQGVIEGASNAWYLTSGTLGLLGAIGFVALTFTLATRLAPAAPTEDSTQLPGRFVHSLIPIAIGYTVAHYFSLLIFDGQFGYILASDPLDRGWDLFGMGDWLVNYLLVSTAAIAWVQVLAIVTGHVLGVISAHDRAMAVFPARNKLTGQLPLLLVMVCYTLGGVGLLVGA
jgi:hypothetical protein